MYSTIQAYLIHLAPRHLQILSQTLLHHLIPLHIPQPVPIKSLYIRLCTTARYNLFPDLSTFKTGASLGFEVFADFVFVGEWGESFERLGLVSVVALMCGSDPYT